MIDFGEAKTVIAKLAKPNVGLRRRMLFVLALAGLPGIVVAVFLTVQKLREETRQIETSVTRLAALGGAQHENILTNAHTLLEVLAKGQRLQSIGEADCMAYRNGWSQNLVYFRSLTLFDLGGQVVCSNMDDDMPYRASNHQWFSQVTSEKRFTVSDYQIGKDGTPLLIAAYPVAAQSGETIGVIALGISLSWLDFIASTVELPEAGSITVLGPEGQILTHNGAGLEDEPRVPAPSRDALSLIMTSTSGTLRGRDNSGSTRVYGFHKTESGGVMVVVGLPQFLEYSEWTNALLQTLVSSLVVLLLALAAAAWASEAFVVRHVRSLISTAGDIAAGNLRARSAVDYDEHELGKLAAAMDMMAEAIEQSQHELEQKNAANEMVAQEMQHRIGNALSLARAIAVQTIRRSQTDDEFIETFTDRLRALSVSNQLLLQGDWKSTDLRELLNKTLSAHIATQDRDVSFDGPDVHIDSRTTLAMALAVHELATNAVKYGAFSQPDGRIAIRWTLEGKEGDRRLKIDWQEIGGPPVTPPSREGFGSKMMKMMIEGKLNGQMERSFTAKGFACQFVFPWTDHVVAEA